MARKVRHSSLETRTARLKLAVRRKPYSGPSLARGVALLYRRNKTNGTWVLKASDGHGKYWTKAIAEADDHDESNGKTILNFFEAQDQAKKLARGDDGSAGNTPITLDGALTAYRTDLEAREPILTTPTGRACISPACCWPSQCIAHGHRVEEMARRPAGRDGTGHDQQALRLPVRRLGIGDTARRAN